MHTVTVTLYFITVGRTCVTCFLAGVGDRKGRPIRNSYTQDGCFKAENSQCDPPFCHVTAGAANHVTQQKQNTRRLFIVTQRRMSEGYQLCQVQDSCCKVEAQYQVRSWRVQRCLWLCVNGVLHLDDHFVATPRGVM